MRFRTFNKLYARLYGYFWLPCPICGQEFGGHEWMKDIESERIASIPHPTKPNIQLGICPECTEIGMGYYGPIELLREWRVR